MSLRIKAAYPVTAITVLGILMAGCSAETVITTETTGITPLSDSEITASFASEGMSNIVINSINTRDSAESDENTQYTLRDTVSVTYEADIMDGILPQTVSKDLEFCLNGTTGSWEMTDETTTACEVDNSALVWSSWKTDITNSDDISALFGGEVQNGDTGTLYIRFSKKIGLFAFNLSNAQNTPTERFFTTVGTGAKLAWAGNSGTVEKGASITGGSVTDSGDLFIDIESEGSTLRLNLKTDAVQISEQEYDEAAGREVSDSKVYMDKLPVFEVTTTSMENGEWKQITGLKEGNQSPGLTWEPVEGASCYAVFLIDTTTTNWLSWYVVTDKTHLDEGEYTDQSVYIGPYPPGTHTYELYVIALRAEPKDIKFPLDQSGGEISQKMNSLNTAADGTTGNVLAYGTIKAPYTAPELYYDYR